MGAGCLELFVIDAAIGFDIGRYRLADVQYCEYNPVYAGSDYGFKIPSEKNFMTQNITPLKERCGLVSIIGRPNVGKSTLLNAILDEKVSIVSKVPQTTRNRIRGIYSDERGQIIFIDTPGFVTGRDNLDKLLKKASLATVQEADCVIHLVDSSEPTGEEEERIVERLADAKIPILVGLNKIDLKGKYVHEYIELWERVKGKSIQEIENLTLLPLSGERKTNIEKLLDLLFACLKEGPALYPKDTVCDIPQKIVIADIIREKLLHIVRQEVPHALTVVIETIEPRRRKTLYIRAVVLVERDSQKEIVIGKAGHVLKEVGTQARQELEVLLDKKIFLETYVKTKKDWRDNIPLLHELGYDMY